jgi:general secretion pathway protein J
MRALRLRGSLHGFTLIELLIAIVILGVLTVIVGGALRLGYSSINKGERRAERLERFRATLLIVEAQMESAVPVTYVEDAETKPYFEGRRDELTIATNYSVWGARRGYVLARYRVEQDTGGKVALIVSETPIGAEKASEFRLVEGFDEIYFEYMGEDATDSTSEFSDDWDNDLELPQQIRMTLVRGGETMTRVMRLRVRKTG